MLVTITVNSLGTAPMTFQVLLVIAILPILDLFYPSMHTHMDWDMPKKKNHSL